MFMEYNIDLSWYLNGAVHLCCTTLFRNVFIKIRIVEGFQHGRFDGIPGTPAN